MKEHYYISFFNNVMIKLGYHDWTIKFCGDNYCWLKDKRINIDLNYNGDVRQIILHEIAHIGTSNYCNQSHNFTFWKRLEYLTWRFMNKSLDDNQKKHKEYSTIGTYGLKYRR